MKNRIKSHMSNHRQYLPLLGLLGIPAAVLLALALLGMAAQGGTFPILAVTLLLLALSLWAARKGVGRARLLRKEKTQHATQQAPPAPVETQWQEEPVVEGCMYCGTQQLPTAGGLCTNCGAPMQG